MTPTPSPRARLRNPGYTAAVPQTNWFPDDCSPQGWHAEQLTPVVPSSPPINSGIGLSTQPLGISKKCAEQGSPKSRQQQTFPAQCRRFSCPHQREAPVGAHTSTSTLHPQLHNKQTYCCCQSPVFYSNLEQRPKRGKTEDTTEAELHNFVPEHSCNRGCFGLMKCALSHHVGSQPPHSELHAPCSHLSPVTLPPMPSTCSRCADSCFVLPRFLDNGVTGLPELELCPVERDGLSSTASAENKPLGMVPPLTDDVNQTATHAEGTVKETLLAKGESSGECWLRTLSSGLVEASRLLQNVLPSFEESWRSLQAASLQMQMALSSVGQAWPRLQVVLKRLQEELSIQRAALAEYEKVVHEEPPQTCIAPCVIGSSLNSRGQSEPEPSFSPLNASGQHPGVLRSQQWHLSERDSLNYVKLLFLMLKQNFAVDTDVATSGSSKVWGQSRFQEWLEIMKASQLSLHNLLEMRPGPTEVSITADEQSCTAHDLGVSKNPGIEICPLIEAELSEKPKMDVSCPVVEPGVVEDAERERSCQMLKSEVSEKTYAQISVAEPEMSEKPEVGQSFSVVQPEVLEKYCSVIDAEIPEKPKMDVSCPVVELEVSVNAEEPSCPIVMADLSEALYVERSEPEPQISDKPEMERAYPVIDAEVLEKSDVGPHAGLEPELSKEPETEKSCPLLEEQSGNPDIEMLCTLLQPEVSHKPHVQCSPVLEPKQSERSEMMEYTRHRYSSADDIQSLKENIPPEIDQLITSEEAKEKLMQALRLCRKNDERVTERKIVFRHGVRNIELKELTRNEKAERGAQQQCALMEKVQNAEKHAATSEEMQPSLPRHEYFKHTTERKCSLRELASSFQGKPVTRSDEHSRRAANSERRRAALAPRLAKKKMPFDKRPTLKYSEEMSKSQTTLKKKNLKSIIADSAAIRNEQRLLVTSPYETVSLAKTATTLHSGDYTDPEHVTSTAEEPTWQQTWQAAKRKKSRRTASGNSEAVAHKLENKAPAASYPAPAPEPAPTEGMYRTLATQNVRMAANGRNGKDAPILPGELNTSVRPHLGPACPKEQPKQAPKNTLSNANIWIETAPSKGGHMPPPGKVNSQYTRRPHTHSEDAPNESEDVWKMGHWSDMNMDPFTETKVEERWKDEACSTTVPPHVRQWSGTDGTETGQESRNSWNDGPYSIPDVYKAGQWNEVHNTATSGQVRESWDSGQYWTPEADAVTWSGLDDKLTSDIWDVESWRRLQEEIETYCPYDPDSPEVDDKPR